MYLPEPYKISYDIKQFQFKEIVCDMFNVNDLENIHTYKHYDYFTRQKDQSTDWHKLYYEKFNDMFYQTYLKLIIDIKNRFKYNQLIYQKIPTIRVHLADGNVAVGEWHKDKTYNHGITEVNFWMPFVDTNEYNTIWMESKEDKKDYKPYIVNYGEILVFDGANLFHGNKNNISCKTRVSVDFRLVDPNKFIPNFEKTINTNTKFDIGGYFEKL